MSIEEEEIKKAYNEGKKIQSQPWGAKFWKDDPNPDWDWNNCDYRINPSELSLMDVVDDPRMYSKFIVIKDGTTLLRIADIEYIEADDACSDIIIYMKSGNIIYESKNVIFYDENGEQFKINTATENGDAKKVIEACARVNGQILIRLISLKSYAKAE